MDSMTDDDASLPIDFNITTQIPRVMEGTNTSMNESLAPGKFSEVHTLKDHEMHISELKKENFELKLRIYFLEEKLQHSQRNVDDDGDAFKINIELKVEIEKLKNELNEKRRLLVKASSAVDSLDRNNKEQIKKLRDQHNRDLDQVKDSYELKLRENEEAKNAANTETEHLKNKLLEAERVNRQIKEKKSKEGGPSAVEATEIQAKLQASLREKDRIIDELKSAVDVRESRIKLLSKSGDADTTEQVKGLKQKIEDRDNQIKDLNEKLKKSAASIKDLRGSVYESERKFQLASQEGISTVQKLNEKLRLKQVEVDDMQERFRNLQQKLEKAQDIIDEASLKDVEAFEEKSKALKAKDALIAELQGNLKQKEMENGHLTLSMARKEKELQRIGESKAAQEDAAHQIYEKEKELKALSEQLTSVKNKLREAADQHDELLQKLNSDYERQLNAKDQIIQRVTETLEDKESIIQDLIVTQENISLSSSLDDITDTKEELIQKLRNRLKERDEAVETNIEEKFQALHEKEEEMQELRKSLRERDRLIENINAVVLNHEDCIKNLESVVEEKVALINDLKTSQKIQEKQFEEANEISLKINRENEGLIEKLNRNLENREQQIENLQNILHQNAGTEVKDSQETELLKELSVGRKEKDKMVADLLSERSEMIKNNEANNEKMMSTLGEKEDLLKDMGEKLNQISSEKNSIIGRLQEQINNLNLDIQSVENSKLWSQQEHEILLGKLKQSLAEKDRTIENLIKSGKEKDKVFLKLQECTNSRATSPVRLEVKNLKNKVDDLEKKLQEKRDVITELERDIEEKKRITNEDKLENMEYTAELEHELEQKDSLLKQAAETIEAFQVKLNNQPVLEELKKNLEETKVAFNESEIQRKRLQSDSQNIQEKHLKKIRALENEVISLQQQKESWLLQRENMTENSSKDQVGRLEELLQQQIKETSRLGEILKKEREAYEDIIKQAKYAGSSNRSGELKFMSDLRQSLEEGIVQNNKLRAQLKEKISRSSRNGKADTSEQQNEVERLHAKLEDSERWNMSLQSRLDALQPRARGVGGSNGNLSVVGTSSSPQPESGEANEKQLEEIKSRLDETQKLNTKLQAQLEKSVKSKVEERTALTQLNEQQKQEIILLRQELKKVNNACEELRNVAKKADAEITSYKKEHDIEFNSLKKALEDCQKINESLKERLKESSELTGRQIPVTSVAERTSLPSSVNVSQLQNELAEKSRMIESLNRKLQTNNERQESHSSFTSFDDIESSADEDLLGTPKTTQIRRLQKDLIEKQKIIEALTEELKTRGNDKDNKEFFDVTDYTNVDFRSTSSPKTSNVNQLEKELGESQKIIQTLREKLEMRKEDKEGQTSFDEVSSFSRPGDVVDGSSRDVRRTSQVNQLRKELEDVYKKNEELRKTVSENIALVDLNRQLKQDLSVSEQKRGVLEKESQNYANKLNELNSEVSHLANELARTRTLNSDYMSQLKGLRRQQEQATRFREEAVNARNMNEKLSAEVQELLASLESVGKENERLREALSASNRSDHSPKVTSASPTSRNVSKDQDSPVSRTSSSRELQALREKLNLSEKLNTALKYELEANKRLATKSDSGSDEPLMGHLEELRQLRSRLEESIKTYDQLCVQLEEKLKELSQGEGREQILKESVSLVKENESLRRKVAQFNEEVKLIQQQLEEHRLTRKRDKEQITLLNNQLIESSKANESLRNELAICDSVIKLSQKTNPDDAVVSDSGAGSSSNDAIMLLLAEIRSLRQQLEASIQSNNSLRQMLQKQLSSSPQRQTPIARSPEHIGVRTSPAVSPIRSATRVQRSPGDKDGSLALESQSLQELRQYINSSFQNAESLLVKIMKISLEEQDTSGKLDELKKDLESLRTLLFKSVKLLDHLWAEHLSSGPSTTDRLTRQNDELRKEITLLKKRVLSQSKILENTATRLESSSRMRKEVERSLFARLSETRDTLGTSRKQLEDRLASMNGN